MNLPTYSELKIDLSTQESIFESLLKSKVGNSPTYINFTHLSLNELQTKLKSIKDAMGKLNIDPKIPFPLYIISPFLGAHSEFPIVKDEAQLPSYFKIRIKQPSAKETSINQKVQILAEKIKNYLDNDKKEDIRKYSIYSKRVYLTKKKELFWDRIIKANR